MAWLAALSFLAAQDGQPAHSRQFTVQPVEIWQTLLFTGELQAARSLELNVPRTSSSFNNTVTYMPLEGTTVKKGERILEFDASALLAQQEEVQRRLDEAKLKIDKLKADLEAQKQDLLTDVSAQETNLKVAHLYAGISKELLPENQYQKYKVDLERAQLAVDKAKERLANFEASYATQVGLAEVDRAQAELDYQKLENDLSLLRIDAPQEGVVMYSDNWTSNRKVQVGDNLFAGQPVMTLPDLSNMRITCFVYDTEVRLLMVGLPAQISLDAVPGRSWKGRVAALTSIAVRKGFASKHKVFKATVDFVDSGPEQLKPGMTARVEIPVQAGAQVLAIPREFVIMDPGGKYAVLKSAPEKGKEPVRQAVRIGTFNSRLVEIVEGLKPGDVIHH